MALSNSRIAWVNRSGTSIPVYEKLVSSGAYVGGVTAGGTKVADILANEFYCLILNSSSNITSYKIICQNPRGAKIEGYIESGQSYTYPLFAWAANQEPYHYYNASGSSLVTSKSETISGVSYRIFTVNVDGLTYKNSTGGIGGDSLPKGTLLATTASTCGQTYGDHMIFYKKKRPGYSWENLTTSSYGFVNMAISTGTFPSTRAIR